MAKTKYWIADGNTSGVSRAYKVYEVEVESEDLRGATIKVVAPIAGVYWAIRRGAVHGISQDDLFATKKEAIEAALIRMLRGSFINANKSLQDSYRHLFHRIFKNNYDPGVIVLDFRKTYRQFMKELQRGQDDRKT